MTMQTTAKDLIRYDLLVQEALKGVVRRVLSDAAKEGLHGEHHFYISFRTEHPGVRLSQRMREKYPEEMTIVLQHQFWDLGVTEHAFEVGLSFSGVPERLLVPFDSIVGFFDPSVQFGLKFELTADAPAKPAADEPKPKGAIRAVPAETPAAEPVKGAASEPAEAPPAKGKGAKQPAAAEPAAKSAATSEPAEPAAEGTARVVSLDAFRKKS